MIDGTSLLVGAAVTLGVVAALGSVVGYFVLARRVDRQGALLVRGLGAMADSLESRDLPSASLRAVAAQVAAPPSVGVATSSAKPRSRRPLTDAEEKAVESRKKGLDTHDADLWRKNEKVIRGIRQEAPL